MNCLPMLPSITKQFVQKLYKMQTKIIQITKFIHIFCTQRLYKSKFRMKMNVQKMYIKLQIYIYIKKIIFVYTKVVQTVQNLYKVQIERSLKLEMYVFCTCKQCANYAVPIQLVCFLYIQTTHKLYRMYTNVNRIIYGAADVYLFIYKNCTFFTFRIFSLATTPSSVLFSKFLKVQDQSFHIKKVHR